MRPGPKPRSEASKRLSGSRHLTGAREPELAAPINLKPPRGRLPLDARKFWKAHICGLVDSGVLKASDVPGFEMLCLAYAQVLEAAAVLKRDGLTTLDERGLIRKHPCCQVQKDAMATYLRFAESFGMVPAGRSRVTVPEKTESVQAALNRISGVTVDSENG